MISASSTHLPFADKTFSRLYANLLINNLGIYVENGTAYITSDVMETLRESVRVLRPGGLAVFSAYTSAEILAGLTNFLHANHPELRFYADIDAKNRGPLPCIGDARGPRDPLRLNSIRAGIPLVLTPELWLNLRQGLYIQVDEGRSMNEKRRLASLLALIGVLASVTVSTARAESLLGIPGLKVAQFDADDTYDPFADYSEFDEAQEEEADINFFRNGRFVTLGFIGGIRGFTEGLGDMYRSSPTFGLFLSYFFDLRFALQFSFQTSDHGFRVASRTKAANGNVGIQNFSLDIKYYVNTQNVTKGLARFNPYIIGGFARVDRTTTIENVQGFGKEGAMAFDLGAGIELPLMRNKMFFGAQAMYQLVNFHDENTEVLFDNGEHTGKYPNGDSYTVLGILGVNF